MCHNKLKKANSLTNGNSTHAKAMDRSKALMQQIQNVWNPFNGKCWSGFSSYNYSCEAFHVDHATMGQPLQSSHNDERYEVGYVERYDVPEEKCVKYHNEESPNYKGFNFKNIRPKLLTTILQQIKHRLSRIKKIPLFNIKQGVLVIYQ